MGALNVVTEYRKERMIDETNKKINQQLIKVRKKMVLKEIKLTKQKWC